MSDEKHNPEYPNIQRLSHINLFRELEAEQTQRKERIKAMCNASYINAAYDGAMVLPSHRLYYCPTPKTACSSWQTMLATLAGDQNKIKKIHNRGYMYNLGIRYSNGTSNLGEGLGIKDYHSFAFVRHPLSRLLSAYLDKFTRDTFYTKYFLMKYGKFIVKRFRPNATSESLRRGHDVTFPEFLSYVISRKDIPIKMDTHWRPQHLMCHFCQIEYDFVGKLEQMSVHGRYILERFIGASDVELLISNTATRSNTEQGYYKDIPENMMTEIIDIYRKDFEYFDYDMTVPSW